jgi:hypothetical protein
MSTRPVSFLSLLLLVAVTPVAAQAPPVGPRFQVNSFVAGDQGGRLSCGYYERRRQDVAADAAGNFIVVWQSAGQDGDGYGIFGQRYDRFGFPEGEEFQVNSRTAGDQKTPAVAMDPAGNFVVVWNSYAPYSDYYGDLFLRRFGPTGTPKSLDFRVSANGFTYTYGGYSYDYFHYSNIRNPDVDTDPQGNFVVVWQHESYYAAYLGDYDQRQVVARRFSSTGAPQGPAFKVSEGADQLFYWNEMPDVATDAGGSFVVVWKAINGYYGGESVLARRYDSTGSALGTELQIDTTQPDRLFESTPTVKSDASGGFLVVWGSSSLDPSTDSDMTDVAARKYDASGTPQTGVFRVNTGTSGSQCGPSLAHLADDSFVVTWHRSYPSPFGLSYGQQLTSAGVPIGSEFLIAPGDFATSTAVAAQGTDFVVVWADDQQYVANDSDVFGQRFGTTAAPACSPAPVAGCRQPTRAGRGAFRFVEQSNPSASRLTWTWSAGELTTHADLGDPITDTSFVLCLYDASANPQPLATLVAPGGSLCGPSAAPCWRALGRSGTGAFQYVDVPGDPHGITQVIAKPGDDGAAKITLTARGTHLALPSTPLTAPVIVQMQATNGECWSAQYDALIRRNEDGRFVAKPSLP